MVFLCKKLFHKNKYTNTDDIINMDYWEKEYRMKGRLWCGHYSVEKIEKKLEKGSRILDAGCGNGKAIEPLIKKGYDVIGFDISKTALKLTEKRVINIGKTSKLVLSDVNCFPFKNNCFDAVVCNYVLTHLLNKERKKCINEIFRVLKTNGFLFIEVFLDDDFRYGKGKKIGENTFMRNGLLYHYFTENEMRELLGCFRKLEIDNIIKPRTINGDRYDHSIISVIAQK